MVEVQLLCFKTRGYETVNWQWDFLTFSMIGRIKEKMLLHKSNAMLEEQSNAGSRDLPW